MALTVSLQEWMLRATAFELLALMYLTPTKESAEALATGDFSDACDEVLQAMGCDQSERGRVTDPLASYAGQDADKVFHELRHEHTHLFVGERFPLITPYAGVWAAEQKGQKGLLFVGRESMDIERFMRRCGVAKNLEAGQANDPVDHVGTMCEFLKYLCLLNAQAVQAPSGAQVEDGDFETFLKDYFQSYARWLSQRSLELARIPFFQASAQFLDLVLMNLTEGPVSCSE